MRVLEEVIPTTRIHKIDDFLQKVYMKLSYYLGIFFSIIFAIVSFTFPYLVLIESEILHSWFSELYFIITITGIIHYGVFNRLLLMFGSRIGFSIGMLFLILWSVSSFYLILGFLGVIRFDPVINQNLDLGVYIASLLMSLYLIVFGLKKKKKIILIAYAGLLFLLTICRFLFWSSQHYYGIYVSLAFGLLPLVLSFFYLTELSNLIRFKEEVLDD